MNKLYIKISLLLLFLSTTSALFAQNVGINTSGTNPSANAILDLNTGNSGNLGLIIPNVSLNPTLTTFGMAGAATTADVGMMVYNTNVSAGNGVGYYYWTGTTWVSVSAGSNIVSACGTAAPNYLPYYTSSNVICKSIIYQGSATKVGVGTTSPQNMLDIKGASAVGASYAGTSAPSNGLIVQGRVGIDTASPSATAQLDIASSTRGVLIPRLASNPTGTVTSLLYYNTTTNCFVFYNGTAWQTFACACNSVPSAPSSISGATSFCINSTGNTYSVAPVTGATIYVWSVPSSVGTIASGQNTNTITITGASSGGSGAISCYAGNSCGISSKKELTITVSPAPTAFTISQTGTGSPGFACPGTTATFSVAAVSGVTYAWSVSSASVGSISGSSTSNTVTVIAGTGATGSVTCVETNSCGSTTENFSFETDGHGSQTFSASGYSWSADGTGTIQTWTVPSCVKAITVTAIGAQGADSYYNGGDGATITETFTVVPSDLYDIVVGMQGQAVGWGGGGGGGTFMWLDSITLGTSGDYPLIVAGGGGGGCGSSLGGIAAGVAATALEQANTGTGGSAGSMPSPLSTYPASGGPGAGWFTGTGTPVAANHTGGGGNGSSATTNAFYGAEGATNSTETGGYGGFGGGGGGGSASSYNPYGAGGGGGGFNGGGGGYGTNADAGEYGGGGGTSGYYSYPDGGYATPAKWVDVTTGSGINPGTHTGNGSLTVYW